MSLIDFLKVARRDIKVGAVMPSSRFAVRKILSAVPDGLNKVFEYGPGDGVLTKELLTRLPEEGRLLAVESNPEFCAVLSLIDDPRLQVVKGDAREAENLAQAAGLEAFDLVISGIPFSLMTPAERSELVDVTHRLLRPGGVFLVYQVSPLMVPYLKKRFEVKTCLALLNIPPYFIMRARRP
ncbi:hypothetical protein AMJ57_04745 [Parcubacteria bacterium SG8_24]|nr:MAG: hypothetical protein AMJ57_04745 [Parcubacteria bacterium SG8_24]